MSLFKKIDKNKLYLIIGGVAIVIVGALLLTSSDKGFNLSGLGNQTAQKVGEKAVNYINNNGLSSAPATLVKALEEDGLIKITIKIGETEFDSYATKNGKFLFPQAFDMSESEEKNSETANNSEPTSVSCETINKTENPVLEAYVVSKCPFGLQMQRMIVDAVNSIPELSNKIQVKYIGSISGDKIIAMHGEAEAAENLRQICIREEQSTKFWNYIACHIKAGKTTECEKEAEIDSGKLNSCVSTPNRGLAYAKKDFDSAEKYNVSASPTLVLGGVQIDEFGTDNKPIFGSARSSDELKNIICCASKDEPSFCTQTLNTTQAATSFSENYGGSGATAGGCE